MITCLAFSIPFSDAYSKKILAITFIIWLFYIKIKDLRQLLKNRVIIVLSLFILSHCFTLFWSENISLGLHYISQMWRYLFIPLLIYTTTVQKDEIKYILHAFVFSMFINEIISYLIYVDLYQTEFSKTRGYPVGFLNHIQYSVLVAFSSILILYQSLDMKNLFTKILYRVFFVTMTTNLVISGGRTGYIVYFVSLLVLFFIYFKPSIKSFILVLLFPTVTFFIGCKYNSQVEARMLATLNEINQAKNNNYNTSIGMRLAYYPLTYDMLKQPENSFLYGVGMGDLEQEMIKAEQRTKLIKHHLPHLHSSYLTAYVNGGIMGLILLLLFLYYLLKLNIKDKDLLFIKYLFILNMSISMLPDIILTQKTMMIYFSLFISILLIQHNTEQETKEKEDILKVPFI
ncbi:MAG: O-antigen ligase family protein [Epsilonproteobacteria bacterium]|nr:O-antigen ligase family protein [Campylobacterota bacterium]